MCVIDLSILPHTDPTGSWQQPVLRGFSLRKQHDQIPSPTGTPPHSSARSSIRRPAVQVGPRYLLPPMLPEWVGCVRSCVRASSQPLVRCYLGMKTFHRIVNWAMQLYPRYFGVVDSNQDLTWKLAPQEKWDSPSTQICRAKYLAKGNS